VLPRQHGGGAGVRPGGAPPRSALPRPGLGYGPGRRGGAPRRSRRDRDDEDEPGPVDRCRQRGGVGRARGVEPRPLEGGGATRAVEDFVHAGFPLDAAAILIVEVDGLPAGVAAAAERVSAIGRAHAARSVRVAVDPAERALIWKGRKNAFGAIARIKPNYYLH